MPLALTIFGVGVPGGTACFCYAQLRSVRGRGGYPQPSLPRSAPSTSSSYLPLASSNVELRVWDQIVEGEQEAYLESGLAGGRLLIPSNSSVDPGIALQGALFAPVNLVEKYNRICCDGAGALWSRGFAVSGTAERVVSTLQAGTGRKEVGAELEVLTEALERESGLGTAFISTCRLGVVQCLSRASQRYGQPGLLAVRVVKPDLRSTEPCRKVLVTRNAAQLDRGFKVHLILRSLDNIVLNRLISFPAGTSELTVEAEARVTKIAFAAFDEETGELADQFDVSMTQSFQFSLVGLTGNDILPPLFRGAPRREELETRARIHTGGIAGPSAGDRAGGFDIMRRGRQLVEMFIGNPTRRRESHFFHSGVEPQMEVILWIKRHLEQADVAEAFLADPYLGSEALKRVIVRHGNETVSLSILVSPAVDPDSADLDAEGDLDRHIDALVQSANELAHQLCGDIRIYHVRRGEGRRQAFHDRVFGLVSREGVPRVYVLSNSLSKAAGDWPFVVVELDTAASWLVTAYVRGLISGNDRGRSVLTEEVWSSLAATRLEAVEGAAPVQQSGPSNSLEIFKRAVGRAYLALHDLQQGGRDQARGDESDKVIDKLVLGWSTTDEDPTILAECIVEGVGGREQHAAAIADRLRDLKRYEGVAECIDALLLAHLLERLAPADKMPAGLPERIDLLLRAGRSIAAHERGTDLVRNRLNPSLELYASTLEVGRSGGQYRPYKILLAGLCLVVVGLEVARVAVKAPSNHRTGLATDHIYLLARLLRTSFAETLFGGTRNPDEPPLPGQDIAREALRLARALGGEAQLSVDAALRRLMIEPLLPKSLKGVLTD